MPNAEEVESAKSLMAFKRVVLSDIEAQSILQYTVVNGMQMVLLSHIRCPFRMDLTLLTVQYPFRTKLV